MKHNFVHAITFTAVVLMVPVAQAVDDKSEIQVETERIQHLEQILSEGGIAGLIAATSRESISVPVLNSKYYAARIIRKDERQLPLETAKNNFGLHVAKELDRYAIELQKKTPSEERAKQACLLLDLAAWLKGSRSHGNYILIMRCENLVTMPLAYLIYDLNYSMEKIAELRDRITSNAEEREFRRAVLNHDSPKPFIGTLNGNDEEQDNQMQYAWSLQWQEMKDWAKAHGKNGVQLKRSDIPEDLAFFLDEQPNGFQSTSGAWNFDRHVSFVYGLREVGLRNLKAFARYRELVGRWPAEPPKWWKPGDSYTKSEAAFEQAWLNFEAENGPLFSTAALVHGQIMEGTYMDYESQMIRSAAGGAK
jgi:hypothetical protein